MTLSTTATSVSYVGNGSTTEFAVSFAFFDADELEVIERTIATGAEVVKTLTTHYTVAGGAGSTGTVTAVTAPASTVEWHIRRKTDRTQTTDFIENDPFSSASVETRLDRNVAVIQEIGKDVDNRALLVPKTAGASGVSVPDLSGNDGSALIVNTAEDGFIFSEFPLQDFVDDASGHASVAASEASDAAASAASASGHDTAAAASAAAASGSASLAAADAVDTANDRSAIALMVATASATETAMDNSISAFEVVRNNASATEVLMANDVSEFEVIAAAMSADQVLVAADKSAVTVLEASAAAHVAAASGHSTAAAASAASASGHEVAAAASAAAASGHEVDAAAHAAAGSGHEVAAAASASAAAASATQAANAAGGVVYQFDNSITDADPGPGEFRLNNGTPGSATALYIDNTDTSGNTIADWVDTWDDSTNTNKGTLWLRGLDEVTAFLIASVTGTVVDGTGYRKVTITVEASGGTFVLGDRFLVVFTSAGDKGSDGAGAGDVVGASSGVTNKFAMWANADTITVGDIEAADVVDFNTAAEAALSSALASKADLVHTHSAGEAWFGSASVAFMLGKTVSDVPATTGQEFLARGGSGNTTLVGIDMEDVIPPPEATKGDIFLMSGGDYLSPRAVQSAGDIVTVPGASGVCTLDLATGRNFRWSINNNATLDLAGEKPGMAGRLEIIKSTGTEAVTFLTAFDAANVELPTTSGSYVLYYDVMSGSEALLLPGGEHV